MASMVAGSNAALTAENPGLGKVLLGIGWDMVPSRGPQSEPVPMVIMCGPDGRAVSDEHLVFFNQIASPEGSVAFAGTEDQEQIDVDLARVPEAVSKIALLRLHGPGRAGPRNLRRRQERLPAGRRSSGTGNCSASTLPPMNMDKVNAMILGELYRHAGGWKFRALGQGYETGLAAVAADFRLKL